MLNQYAENDMIVRELSEILLGLGNGRTLEEMISAFGARSGNEDIENFSNVMANCYRLGGDFKNVVRRTRDIIRDKIAIADEIETKLASNKLQYNAMCIMPLVLVAMLKVSNSDFAVNLGLRRRRGGHDHRHRHFRRCLFLGQKDFEYQVSV